MAENAVIISIMAARGTPDRCGFAWIDANGNWVRCLNSKGKKHGLLHEHALDNVLVGQETDVLGLWVDGTLSGTKHS